RPGRGRVQQLRRESSIQRPFVGGHDTLLEQAARENFRVLIPGAIEDPTSTQATHAAHGCETCGEKMELQRERICVHFLRARVEALKPRILRIHALERE